MSPILYRDLTAADTALVGAIGRSEQSDGVYELADGALVFKPARQRAAPWTPREVADHAKRLRALLRSGGRVFAAWDAGLLVGMGSLDPSGIGGDAEVMKLDMLYVDAAHRGLGIGRTLTDRAAVFARMRGARALYISATPTKATVDAYLRMGAKVIAVPDPTLWALEPEDIHLILELD